MIAAATRAQPAATVSRRQGHLDWLRGVAVLIMIEAHVIDSWTGVPDRHTHLFAWSMVLGGFGAPLFLFLAGVAVALSAGSKARKAADAWAAALAVMRRGGEIFGLAFLFRLQSWILGWSSYRDAAEGRHPEHHGPGDRRGRRDLGAVLDGAGAGGRVSRDDSRVDAAHAGHPRACLARRAAGSGRGLPPAGWDVQRISRSSPGSDSCSPAR